MTAPSPRYRQLALATLLMTFLLIVIGGIVRVSDSGLGLRPGRLGIRRLALMRTATSHPAST